MQETTRGLLVWRKADNLAAFTDGYRSWVNGPYGIQQRLNAERFDWEPADPQAIKLTLNDMPAGFVPMATYNRFQYNEGIVAEAVDPAKIAQLLGDSGRMYGYISGFQQSGPSGLTGTLLVVCDVDLFESTEGAHLAFDEYEKVLADYGMVPTFMPGPAVGDETKAFKVEATRGEGAARVSLTYYSLVFRKGKVVAGVSTVGVTGGVGFKDNVKYARTLESRIR